MAILDGPKIIVIVGPTSSGKSAVALELAKKIGGEIVNADSRQIYQYLNVATAKPKGKWVTPTDCHSRESGHLKKKRWTSAFAGVTQPSVIYTVDGISHHLYDFLNPKKTYSAGEYAEDAAKIISAIFSRKHIPILVGGTGFYIRALFDGLPQLPKRDEKLRAKLAKLAEEKGKSYLHEQLKQVDSISAEKIPYQNIQRAIRALEVYHLTKQPLSSYPHPNPLPSRERGKDWLEPVFFGLRWEREELKERIRKRTEKMFPALIQETKELLQRGFSAKDTGLQSVGYRETIQHLEGKISQETLLQQILQRTYQYAKRQMTWFKADKRVCWLEIQEPFHPGKVAEQIVNKIFV